MSTKKWLLKARLKEQHIEALKGLYPDYEMITDDAETEAFSVVEWTVGWNDELTNLLEEGKLPSLKWVQAISAGVNSLPLETFERKGICLTNASGIHAEPIAEYVIGVLLSHMRGLKAAILNQPIVQPYDVLTAALNRIGVDDVGTVPLERIAINSACFDG